MPAPHLNYTLAARIDCGLLAAVTIFAAPDNINPRHHGQRISITPTDPTRSTAIPCARSAQGRCRPPSSWSPPPRTRRSRRCATTPHTTTVDVRGAQAFGRARLKEEAIDPLLPDLRREIKALTAVTAALKEAPPRCAASRWMSCAWTRPDRPADVQETAGARARARAAAGARPGAAAARRRLRPELRAALAEQGVVIGGRPPKFEIGRFELEANFVSRSASCATARTWWRPTCPSPSTPRSRPTRARPRRSPAARSARLDCAVLRGLSDCPPQTQRASDRGAHQHRRRLPGARAAAPGPAFASEPSKPPSPTTAGPQFIYDFYEFTGRQRMAYQGQGVMGTLPPSRRPIARKSMWIVEGDSPYDGHSCDIHS